MLNWQVMSVPLWQRWRNKSAACRFELRAMWMIVDESNYRRTGTVKPLAGFYRLTWQWPAMVQMWFMCTSLFAFCMAAIWTGGIYSMEQFTATGNRFALMWCCADWLSRCWIALAVWCGQEQIQAVLTKLQVVGSVGTKSCLVCVASIE